MTDKTGIYIHIPFCRKKCAYCDFYSVLFTDTARESYRRALFSEIKKWGGKLKNRPIDTVYIGGGTPSLLGEEIIPLVDALKESFNILKGAEITAEANPEDTDFLPFSKRAGVNRLSVGAQTFSDKALCTLGRRHTAESTERFFRLAREQGFDNISLDLMIGLPNQTKEQLRFDTQKLISLSPEHISCYILKKEERTRFFKENISLPDDDFAADGYLFVCRQLEKAGYNHYEISNFAKKGRESRHNLKYWETKEYLGIGPAAHSFLFGERFFYPRDFKSFTSAPHTVSDGEGGGKEERLMLALRLGNGADLSEYYGEKELIKLKQKAEAFSRAGLISGEFPHIHLTDSGMLLSNSIITELIL